MYQNYGSFYWLISSGSFFFLLTQAEKRAFSKLKFRISAEVRKKNRNFKTCKPVNICYNTSACYSTDIKRNLAYYILEFLS